MKKSLSETVDADLSAAPVSASQAVAAPAGSPGWLMAVQGLALLALLISGYLTVVSLTHGGSAAGCGEVSGCGQVLGSRWSRWMGLPVAAMAAAVYGGLLIAAGIARRRSASLAAVRRAWTVMVLLAVLCAGAAAWFLLLQLFVLRSICPYCLVVHGCGVVVAGMVLWRLPMGETTASSGLAIIQYPVFAVALLGGVVLTAALAAGQWWGPRMQASLFRHADGGPAKPRTDRTVVLHGGAVQFEPEDFPLAGPPAAPLRMALFTDYTCPHCRHMHRVLTDAAARWPGRFAVFILPMPLSPQCNPHMPRAVVEHAHACALAKLALAVWKADPDAFTRMHEWLMADFDPPDPADARAYAARLVTPAALESAEADPSVQQALDHSIRIFNEDTRTTHLVLPKLMLPAATLAGPVESAKQVLGEIEKALPPSPPLGERAPPHTAP